MSLQLIAGRSGSGKTTWLYEYMIRESMAHPDQKYMILVPEQFTMETQRMITQMHPRHGTLNIDVLSFARLAYQVLAELNKDDYVVIDEMGKSVLLQKAALRHAKDLPVFGRNLKRPGFISQLKSQLSEIIQYGVDTLDLDHAVEKLQNNHMLAGKLKDMSLVYESFREEMDDKSFTSDQLLIVLADLIPKSNITKDCIIGLDGYTGFTPVQYMVIEQLLSSAEKLMITVTVDPAGPFHGEAPSHDLFHLGRHTVVKLMELAQKALVEVEDDVILRGNPRYAAGSELAFLEENVLRFSTAVYQGKDGQKPGNGQNDSESEPHSSPQITMRNYKNPTDEIKGICGQIYDLVMNQGVRYREIALITSSMDTYGNILQQQLPVYGIPYFMDRKSPLMNHPLAEYIRGLLEIMTNDFSYESIFRFLKCGLTGLDLTERDYLENYVLAKGIRGRKLWSSRWEMPLKSGREVDFDRLDRIRLQVAGPLLDLYCRLRGLEPQAGQDAVNAEEGIRTYSSNSTDGTSGSTAGAGQGAAGISASTVGQGAAGTSAGSAAGAGKAETRTRGRRLTVREITELLVAFLEEFHVEQRLAEKAEQLNEQGEVVLAGEYRQAYGLVMELLGEIVSLMGDQETSLKDYSLLFDSGLEEIRVGQIPARTDRLMVGDMERTRLSGIRHLFFAGVNDGLVPKEDLGGGIFTDYDKEQLESVGIELSPTGREKSVISRFYLYLALAKPSEGLHISFTKADGGGKGMRPAECIREIRNLFPGLQIQDMEEMASSIGTGEPDFWQYLVTGFGNLEAAEKDPVWTEVFCHFYRKYPERTERLLAAYLDGYQEESLTRELAGKLYGKALKASVSRLEMQSACAFSHFLRYGLHLQEREIRSFENTDMGTLFHETLAVYFRMAAEQNLDITKMSEDQRRELTRTSIEEAAVASRSDILQDNARSKWLYGRLTRVTEKTVWALGEQLKDSGYHTEGCEVEFTPRNSRSFVINLDEGARMLLNGRIDRIDIREKSAGDAEADKIYVRIIDYKSGSQKFDLVSVYYGTQIQLVFYMEAAEEYLKRRYGGHDIMPGGVFYYNISDPIIDRQPGMDEAALDAAALDQLQMNGLAALSSMDSVPVSGGRKKKMPVSLVEDWRFHDLQRYVHDNVRSLGNQILDGRIGVNPYRRGNRNACTYCPYQGICGFDLKRDGYRYRNLVTVAEDDLWDMISSESSSGSGSGSSSGSSSKSSSSASAAPGSVIHAESGKEEDHE